MTVQRIQMHRERRVLMYRDYKLMTMSRWTPLIEWITQIMKLVLNIKANDTHKKRYLYLIIKTIIAQETVWDIVIS